MLFFQGSLFLGYLYAHGSSSLLGVKKQSSVHLFLLLCSMVYLPIGVKNVELTVGTSESLFVLVTLFTSVFLPFFLLECSVFYFCFICFINIYYNAFKF